MFIAVGATGVGGGVAVGVFVGVAVGVFVGVAAGVLWPLVPVSGPNTSAGAFVGVGVAVGGNARCGSTSIRST